MPNFGDLFIFAALSCAIASMALYILFWRGKEDLHNLARGFYVMTTMFLCLAIFDLMYLILSHNFSVAYVFSYSSTDLPLGYLIATLWGGQEGTFLLWIFFASIFGLVMMYTSGKFEKGNMVFLNLFIISIILILLKKSPFELLPVAQSEGQGLNPLLQNFWMTIHPPIMFVGFAAVVFPFCFAMTALVERKYNLWAEYARKWTMFAWVALGTSLVMGGYWAYKTLGWGGFWAWDPVENSSFIPWVFLTTQIHSLFIKRQRRGLLRFSLFIVSLTFWSVLYGTFLTRSGVLADFSVHSFVDLGINQYLTGGLIFFIGMGLFLLLYRWQDISPEPSFSKINSRSYLVTIGVLILFVGGVLILLGTSAPLLSRMTDNPSNVGLSYYFATMTPIAIVLLFLISIFPAFKWNEGISKPIILKLGGIAAVLTTLILLITGITSEFIYLLFFSFAVSAITANGYVIFVNSKKRRIQPGYFSHVGLAIALIGAAASAGFETKKTITLPQNEIVNAMGYQLKFVESVDNPKGFNCHVEVEGKGMDFVAILPHEFPKNSDGVMKKPHVEKRAAYDLYLAPVAFKPGQDSDRSIISLQKGASAIIDKYKLTFKDFELDSHGDTESLSKATALLTVEYDGKSEVIEPYLEVTKMGVDPVAVTFDYNKASILIAGVNPEDGSVMLEVTGDFLSQADIEEASLVIELSEKPLINLFWFGTFLVFFSGAWSMYERKRKSKAITKTIVDKLSEKEKDLVTS